MASIQEIVQAIWDKYDSDNDGSINLEESRAFYEELAAKRSDLNLTADNINQWFGSIDSDSDGSISKPEME